jgi:hypothetical protein
LLLAVVGEVRGGVPLLGHQAKAAGQKVMTSKLSLSLSLFFLNMKETRRITCANTFLFSFHVWILFFSHDGGESDWAIHLHCHLFFVHFFVGFIFCYI